MYSQFMRAMWSVVISWGHTASHASMLEQAGMDYFTTARAKGLTERRIMFVLVLRNALLPVVTMAGVQVGALIGGSVIVESVFAWPGLGLVASGLASGVRKKT